MPPLGRRTTRITAFCAAFLSGLWLGQAYWQVDWRLLPPLAAVAFLSRRHATAGLLAVAALALGLGVWRGHAALGTYAELDSLIGHKVTLIGTVSDDPAIGTSGFTTFTLGRLHFDGRPIPGQIRATTYTSSPRRGHRLEVTGKLKPTPGTARASAFVQIKTISAAQSPLEHMRQSFFAGARTALPEPLASFGLGLLVGIRALLPRPVQDSLTVVGLSHLVAVSGYNLTILINAIYRPLRRHSIIIATFAILWLILGFMLVTGFSASIVRAAVISILSLLAAFYGRRFHPAVLVGLAAAGTAAVRPDYLWADLGWQLSFLAFIGIIIVAPAFEARFIRRPGTIKRLAIESIVAQIMTFPLIAAVFGNFSVVAPLANLIVLPLVPAAMLTAFIASLAGIIVPAAAGWLAWPAALTLGFMLTFTQVLAGQPWSEIRFTIDSAALWAIYLALAAIVAIATRRQSRGGQPARSLQLPVFDKLRQ